MSLALMDADMRLTPRERRRKIRTAVDRLLKAEVALARLPIIDSNAEPRETAERELKKARSLYNSMLRDVS